ncbi:hypothetical protein T265_12559, partial [Opisthorchis viverrini]
LTAFLLREPPFRKLLCFRGASHTETSPLEFPMDGNASVPSWSSAFTEEELRMINELQARMVASPQKPNTPPLGQKALDVLADLQISCLTIAEECSKPENFTESKWPLRTTCIYQGMKTCMKWDSEVGDFVGNCLDSISVQLDDVMASAICNSKKRPKNEHLWASFVIRDMKRVIDSIGHQCEALVRQRIADASYIRLGRVYAWAREQRNADMEDEQLVTSANQLRSRLRCRLARLVWLTRASKRRARSHPILTSMKHELLRIRTHTMGQLCSERTAAMGPTETPSLRLDKEESSEAALRRVIPSQLYGILEQLIDKLTVVFLELPPQVPGVCISENLEDLTLRREFLKQLITRTILGFYDHLDASVNIETHAEDGAGDRNPGSASPLVFPQEMDSAESDAEAVDEAKTGPGARSSTSSLNPALVQAALDGFDHHRYASRKRAMPTTISVFQEEDRLASDAVADSRIPRIDTTRENDQTEEILSVLRRPTVPVVTAESSGEEATCQNHIEAGSKQSRKATPLCRSSTSPVRVSSSSNRPSGKVECSQSNAPKNKSFRSLRTRDSRTPSDNSFSEGEVLSDSEEERADSVSEVEEPVTDLGEKTNVDIEEEEAEELIRMVNEQLRDRTPASDIDLTELEIMDEWAPPTSSMVVASRTETESSQPEISAPEVEQLSAEEQAALEEVTRKIAEIVDNALNECGKGLDELVLCAEQNAPIMKDSIHAESQPLVLSEDTEASIERTASAFKEHVTSVLTNLLHAIPLMADGTNGSVIKLPSAKKPDAAPPAVITGRRGSRLMGMLRAYQQDAVKRMSSSAK